MPRPITDYPGWVLGTLLDKYENSTAFRTGVFSRRILLTIPKETRLQEALEQPDEKRLFLAALDRLKAQGLIDYSWVRYEQGNLVDQVWLVPERIGGCYQVLGRTAAADRLEAFQNSVSAALEKLPPDSDFAAYLREVQQYTAARKKLRAPFSEDTALNENLLKCLVLIGGCPDLMERVFSSRYFGDSKYFERVLKAKVISILKELHKRAPEVAEDGNSLLSEDDLLAERGLYRWPEVFEFNGALTFHLDDGTCFDTAAQRYGAYINSDTVKHLAAVDGSAIRRVVFIENKANYIDFQARRRQSGDLVVYHGGFYSPVKGLLFTKIYEGCPNADFYHWSDIDLGGFRLFCRLRGIIAPTVQPLFMDVETLERNAASCMEITTPAYLAQLSALLDDAEYAVFWDVIRYMTAHRVRLEQENLIE